LVRDRHDSSRKARSPESMVAALARAVRIRTIMQMRGVVAALDSQTH
jgi:hypothetical protein